MVVTAVPTDATELCFATASDIARWIRDGEISARDVMSAHLAQIERVNPRSTPSSPCLMVTNYWIEHPHPTMHWRMKVRTGLGLCMVCRSA